MNFYVLDSKKEKKYDVFCQEGRDYLTFNIDNEKWKCVLPLRKFTDLCICENTLLNYTIEEFGDGKLCLKHFNNGHIYFVNPIIKQEICDSPIETNMNKFCVFDFKKEKKYDVFCQVNNDIVTVNVEYNNDKKWRCFIPLSIYLNFCIRENTLLNYTINDVFNGIFHANLFLKHIDNKEIHLLNLVVEQENVRTISSNIIENKQETKIESCNVGFTGPTGAFDPIVENNSPIKEFAERLDRIDDKLKENKETIKKYMKCENSEIKNDEKPPVALSIQEQIIDKFFSESFAKLTFKVEGKIMGLDFNASVEKKI